MIAYHIEIRFDGVWTRVSGLFDCVEEAEWQIGLWEERNQCFADEDFRVVKSAVRDDPMEVFGEEIPW